MTIVPPSEQLGAPISQIPCFDLPPFEVPDSHNLIIIRNHIQSLVAPSGVFTFNFEYQPFDRPLDPDADLIAVTATALLRGLRNGINVKSERDFSRRRERKVLEWLWPRITTFSECQREVQSLYCVFSFSFFDRRSRRSETG